MVDTKTIQNLLETSIKTLEADSLAVYQLDESKQAIHLVAWVGEEAPRKNAPLGVGIVGECAKKQEALSLKIKHANPNKYQSQVAIPLVKNDSLFGVLQVASKSENHFDSESRQRPLKTLVEKLEGVLSP